MKARGLSVLGIGLVCLAAVQADDVTTLKYDYQRTGFTPEKVSPPLSLLWKFSTAEDKGISAQPLVVGDRIFFCAQGSVYALEAETGQTVWEPLFTGYDIRMTPVYHDGLLYVGNQAGEMYVVDPADEPQGERIVAIVDFKSALRCTPVIIGDKMYVINDAGELYETDLKTRELTRLHRFRAGPKEQMAYFDDLLLWTGRDNVLHCWSLKLRRQLWAQNQGALVSAPIIADKMIVIGTRDGTRAVRKTSGRSSWTVRGVSGMRGSPSYAAGKIFVSSRDEFLNVLDPGNRGKVLNRVEMDSPVQGTATIADRDLYIGTGAGNVYAVDVDTMAFKWFYRCSPMDTVGPDLPQYPIDVPLVVANGAVYAVSDQGTLFCFRPDAIDVGKPRLYLPQIVTIAVDNSEVAFPTVDDELRAAMVEDAEAAAGEGEDPDIPEEAKDLALPGKQRLFRFETYVYDEGSGVDMQRIVVKWDGQPYISELITITPNDNLLTVDLVSRKEGAQRPRLPDGKHTLSITVPDYRGNTVERLFTFTIDNTLPPIEPPEEEKPTVGEGGPVGMPGAELGLP